MWMDLSLLPVGSPPSVMDAPLFSPARVITETGLFSPFRDRGEVFAEETSGGGGVSVISCCFEWLLETPLSISSLFVLPSSGDLVNDFCLFNLIGVPGKDLWGGLVVAGAGF